MDSPPTEACTFFGKHAYTGEDGFGMEYKYDLQFQGTILNIILHDICFLDVVELVTSLIWVILVTVVVLIKGEAGFGLMNRFRR